ncbi:MULTISPECIES: DUF1456 family protein [Pseudomonas]|uniref:DUF1456 domain-containing protein n=1 Tax=Pseudomonas kuykendallii TaxID=1007099 RepID=A0A2W5D580_9PSED|nr:MULTISPECIES: DUF1456 family protein [Pseudomonas]PZP23600.1 MAG: DUF1456 domain-containing protein [Pseudomonas kuykendallii]
MMNNDVLRSLRYMLDVSEPKLVKICQLADYRVSIEDMAAYLKKDDEEGFQPCSDEVMAHFLDGLVFYKRGKDESRPRLPVEKRITNNAILKKLRVAFELRDEDMHAILEAAELPMGKAELSALFRKPGHNNYRECGDQVLRNFLRGLTLRVRPAD